MAKATMDALAIRVVTVAGGSALFAAFLLISASQEARTTATLAAATALIALCCGLGAMGVDHVLVRLAGVEHGRILLPNGWRRYLTIGWVCVAIIAGIGAVLARLPAHLIPIGIVFGLLSCVCTSAGSLLRISGDVVRGSIYTHFWKFAFLATSILMYVEASWVWLLVVLSTLLPVAALAYGQCIRLVQSGGRDEDVLAFLPAFSISVIVISGLGYLDRVLAVRVLSVEDAAIYGLLSNVVLGPATTVAAAIGFSDVGRFKTSISPQSYKRSALKGAVECMSIAAFFGVLVLIWKEHFTPLIFLTHKQLGLVLLLLVCLAGMRGYYAASSAAMSVIGSKSLINRLNVTGVLLVVLLLCLLLAFQFGILTLLALLGVVWVVRVRSFDSSVKQVLGFER